LYIFTVSKGKDKGIRMKVKKLFATVTATLLLSVTALCSPISQNVVHAATAGTMMSNAIEVNFNQEYYKSWGRGNDHLNHYCQITVPSTGILTVTATKPFDDEGEYGSIYFNLYDESGDSSIWDTKSSISKTNARDYYQYRIGLAPGTYYMTMRPGFIVRSGNIETQYSFRFEATSNCEIEPNNGLAQATVLQPGTSYTGYLGSEYGSDEADYYKMYMTAGTVYRVAVGNYAKLDTTTTLIKLITPTGQQVSTSSMSTLVDDNGMNYLTYTPSTTGYYYLKLYNYSKEQITYQVRYSAVAKQETAGNGTANTTGNGATNTTGSNNTNTTGSGATNTTGSNNTNTTGSGVTNTTGNGTIKITPAKVTLKKVVNKHSYLYVTWKCSNSSAISGYEIQVSTNKNFRKNVKKYTVKSKAVHYNVRSLKKNKTYYVRIRTYIKSGSTKTYSAWSSVQYKKLK
jgi:hypothetical protein